MVQLKDVRKVFASHDGGTHVALDGVNLSVNKGDVLGVIGRSGAGKSTLIRLLNGLEKPTSGSVIVNGDEISSFDEVSLRQARRSIGMIFQHFNLLSSRTVAQNIALPLELAGANRSDITKRVDELLDLVGLSDRKDRYPSELSGGQKQRVGIARALATNPEVLLSDEATSALDPETTRSILELLSNINRELGLTIVLITHEMAVVRSIANQVAVIEHGHIVEQGDVFDIFTRPAHDVTRSFLGHESGRALPPSVAAKLKATPGPKSEAVVRIIFRGPHATDPVLAQLATEADIAANIVSGSIDEVGGRPFGIITVSLPSDPKLLDKALTFLKVRHLDTEVLGYVD
ncbi:methionine ABC transporter ATP-binding protein [Microvirga sp. W0021]|uniref:Methionine ABC transporter ATP-binding protein n=1 Tax=Hohaiivirga grylli TaxID=3133970 RepID=A0ABV0BGW3_9HYPH